MGDVAMTIPVLRALIHQYPEVKITVLTREFFTPFFRDLSGVEVFSAEVNGKHKGLLGLYKLAKTLNIKNFDCVADLHDVLRSKILRRLVHADKYAVIDKGRKDKKALISGKQFQPLKSTHERYADVFRALGFPLNLGNPVFPKKASLSDVTKPFISKTKKNIGVAPFATYEGKMYPLELMKKVIEELASNYHVILFGGGSKEKAILEDFERQFKHVVNVVGKLDLRDELDLISNLDVMLSMDSGNAHMAAMYGVKVVTIWGVTHPYAGFTPFNQPENHALLPDRVQFPMIPTSVYGNKYPEAYKKASGSILPHDIVSKVKAII
ncbi:glycosyltransferase family 9 protein [Tamlana fucoidanivorans]|uniref:Glycosyltransferase family 9 protein n=2 Tax=Allotamlana fucoidanivorans TaxID=2583814 RepID=A0A5C4SSK6_9FLAO|nr:glycosyltransferase family 9 protein [Tamlana fucoidanivorans]